MAQAKVIIRSAYKGTGVIAGGASACQLWKH